MLLQPHGLGTLLSLEPASFIPLLIVVIILIIYQHHEFLFVGIARCVHRWSAVKIKKHMLEVLIHVVRGSTIKQSVSTMPTKKSRWGRMTSIKVVNYTNFTNFTNFGPM